jgi:hypothetical protein
MHRTGYAWLLLFAAVSGVPASVCAMNSPQESACHVVGAERLPKGAGGAAAICSAFERAIAAQAPGVQYTAEVRILSQWAIAVDVVADGHKLPEQKFSVSDRNLNPGSIERFANAVGEAVADARRT